MVLRFKLQNPDHAPPIRNIKGKIKRQFFLGENQTLQIDYGEKKKKRGEKIKKSFLLTKLKYIKFPLYSNDGVQHHPQNMNQKLYKFLIDKPTAFYTSRTYNQTIHWRGNIKS